MTIELANRLIEFRKRFNYSQEDLASKLNVSRQSISKWESGECSPSIDYVKELSIIYKVSVDDLINVNKPVEDCYKKEEDLNQKKNKNNVHVGKDGIHVESEDGDKVDIDLTGIHINEKIKDACYKKTYNSNFGFDTYVDNGVVHIINKVSSSRNFEKILGIIDGIVWSLLVITYILLGFLYKDLNGWALFWPILILGEVPSSLARMFYYRKLSHFPIWAFAISSYLMIGMRGSLSGAFNGWHPYWVIFLSIPIYYTLSSSIDKIITMVRYKNLKEKTINTNIVFDFTDKDEDKDD